MRYRATRTTTWRITSAKPVRLEPPVRAGRRPRARRTATLISTLSRLVRGVSRRLDQPGWLGDGVRVSGEHLRVQVWVELDVRRLHRGQDKSGGLVDSRNGRTQPRVTRRTSWRINPRWRVHAVPRAFHERSRGIVVLRVRRRVSRGETRRRVVVRRVRGAVGSRIPQENGEDAVCASAVRFAAEESREALLDDIADERQKNKAKLLADAAIAGEKVKKITLKEDASDEDWRARARSPKLACGRPTARASRRRNHPEDATYLRRRTTWSSSSCPRP